MIQLNPDDGKISIKTKGTKRDHMTFVTSPRVQNTDIHFQSDQVNTPSCFQVKQNTWTTEKIRRKMFEILIVWTLIGASSRKEEEKKGRNN